VILTTPLSGTICYREVVTFYGKPTVPIKFEVPNFTRYGNIKDNVENGMVRGHPTLLAMLPFDRAYTTSYSSLTETIPLILYHSWNIAFDRSKIAVFCYPSYV